MKSRILIGMGLAVLVSGQAMAAYVTPEVTRDGKSLNDSPLAVTWQQRTGVGYEYSQASLDDADIDQDAHTLYGFTNINDMVAFEGGGTWASQDDPAGDVDMDAYRLMAGIKATDSIAVGVGYTSVAFDSDLGDMDVDGFDLGVGWHEGEWYTGVGYKQLSYDPEGGSSDDEDTWFVAAGFQNTEGDGVNSVELAYINSDFDSIDSDSDGFVLNGTVSRGIWQVDGSYSMMNVTDMGLDDDIDTLNLEVEVLVSENIYVAPGYMNVSSDAEDTDLWSIAVGYRTKDFDIDLTYGQGDVDPNPGASDDLDQLTLNAVFNF